jgi:hypothetical protein
MMSKPHISRGKPGDLRCFGKVARWIVTGTWYV